MDERDMTSDERESVRVATVRRAHALQGELSVALTTDHPEHVFREGRLFRVSGGGPIGLAGQLTLARARPHSGGYILAFEEIADRTLAERYRGRHLSVRVEELAELGEGEYFFHDLIGLEVRGPGGERLGGVRGVYDTAAAPLLAVERDGREALVPIVREIVDEVDLEERVVRIRPPEGLLDLDL